MPIGIMKAKTHRSNTRPNHKRSINITFYQSHSWFLPPNRPRILNRNNVMKLQLVGGKPLIPDDERHASNLARRLNIVIPDLVVSIMPNAPK
ncbi:hypothetical protein L195_g041716 [Trifolium pratense]|uniref:Uncharacterized protein n=1 Tax=Trifolium pratense TaxID=57577 RepID=A0A2K3M4D2_TRIPR|nr:hypothetical protein L195_g041716 [Trifolium pratense]